MYMATRYIGGKYTPGEIVGEELTEEQVKWLVKTGALKEITPPAGMALGERRSADAEAADEAEMQTGETEDEETETIDEETDAPEVDVMSGIVSEAKEEPKKRSTARKESKK